MRHFQVSCAGRRFRALVVPACLALFAGCAQDQAGSATPDGDHSAIQVVATHSILGDWVVRIGGDRVRTTVLVGPEGDAHTYEPTPKDGVALASSQAIFENGLGFEVWLDEVCESSRTSARRCVVTRHIAPRTIENSAGAKETDPHVWQSPSNAMSMVRAIMEDLAALDPEHASEYEGRGARYLDELRTLDQEFRDQFSRLAPERRVLVTTHDSFGYFAAEYGFEVFSVLGALSSEATDPTAGEIAAVIERLRQLKTPAVFSENILNPKLTEQVASEAGVKVVRSLYTDALGPAGSAGADYLGMMRCNMRTIVEALR